MFIKIKLAFLIISTKKKARFKTQRRKTNFATKMTAYLLRDNFANERREERNDNPWQILKDNYKEEMTK